MARRVNRALTITGDTQITVTHAIELSSILQFNALATKLSWRCRVDEFRFAGKKEGNAIGIPPSLLLRNGLSSLAGQSAAVGNHRLPLPEAEPKVSANAYRTTTATMRVMKQPSHPLSVSR